VSVFLDGQLDERDEQLLLAADRLRDAYARRFMAHKACGLARASYEAASAEETDANSHFARVNHEFQLLIERQAKAQSAPADKPRGITLRQEPAAPVAVAVDGDTEIPF
jgi:hypothetical protein